MHRIALAVAVGLGLAAALAAPGPALGQPAAADTVALSFDEALDLGLQRNPRIHQAAAERSVAGAGLWSAWGNLLPQLSTQGSIQRSEEGAFVISGTRFLNPASFTTSYQLDITHSLLDSGRDFFRIKEARAEADRVVARLDGAELEIGTEIKRQYLAARRQQALVRQAEREIERREQHLRLAEARYEVGSVTRSDVLQARLSLTRGEVALLQAKQNVEESRLALRRLLGGALPEAPIELTSDFRVFRPGYEVDALVGQALQGHPSLRETLASERAGEAQVWIARSRYLPTFQVQYSISRSIVDTADFSFDDFDERNFWGLSVSWPLFGRFDRYHQTSRANATLETAREERRARALEIEEGVRVAHSRLRTAYATYEANVAAVELAQEDLRLGEARYETGTGSFVDLLDARVRTADAETSLIASTYDFYLALVALERATGVNLFPEGAVQ